jgi:putative endonuclease
MATSRRARAAWVVYVVQCRDASLYVGITNDLDKRLRAHNAGTGGRYTRSRRPVSLAFVRKCRSATVARRLEVAFKRLDRARRLRLVAGDADVLALALADVARMARAARRRAPAARAGRGRAGSRGR